jgi:hypothetical protein
MPNIFSIKSYRIWDKGDFLCMTYYTQNQTNFDNILYWIPCTSLLKGHVCPFVCDLVSAPKLLDKLFFKSDMVDFHWKLRNFSFEPYWSIIQPTLLKAVYGLFHVHHKPLI